MYISTVKSIGKSRTESVSYRLESQFVQATRYFRGKKCEKEINQHKLIFVLGKGNSMQEKE